MNKITHIVVHYDASYPDQDHTARDIDLIHRARGFNMIGYHYFLRRNGQLEIGRPEHMTGAHVGGQNTGKIGICWAGGLERETGSNHGVDNRTPEQTEELIKLIRELKRRHPDAEVVGHKDLAPTQCPAFDVRAWWAEVNKPKPASPKHWLEKLLALFGLRFA